MPDANSNPVMQAVRRALGRDGDLVATPPPPPPEIEPKIVRLVAADANLPERFFRAATEAKMHVERVAEENLIARIIAFLAEHAAKKIGVAGSPLLDRLVPALKSAGFDAASWTDLTLDQAYDLDCGITDVYAAIAETGSLVIRPDATHGRALSLVPPIHIAIVRQADLLPDLLDLFERLSRQNPPPSVTLITGPSKTADIESHLVTGVHGPGIVRIFWEVASC